MNTPTVILAGILVARVFSVRLSRNISTKSSSLKALHIRIDGDVCKRIVKELGEQMIVRQNKTPHTFQELSRPHKRLIVGTIIMGPTYRILPT